MRFFCFPPSLLFVPMSVVIDQAFNTIFQQPEIYAVNPHHDAGAASADPSFSYSTA